MRDLVSGSAESATLDVPLSLTVETARNYAYAARRNMALDERVKVTLMPGKLMFSKLQVVDPLDMTALAEPALKPQTTEGVAVLLKWNERIAAAAAELLAAYAVTAIEIVGKQPSEIEPTLPLEHGLLVTKCKRGTLLS